MSRLIDRYPTIRRIQLIDGGEAAENDISALIAPYLDWQLGEMEDGRALLLFKHSTSTSANQLHEQMVVLLGDVAVAWLNLRYASTGY